MTDPEPSTDAMAARQAREETAALVEACTDILPPVTARMVASRIRALGEPEMRRWNTPWVGAAS
jgi:hypothetical protein